nr:hypothetical protein [Tanacetum cinerariifolium]
SAGFLWERVGIGHGKLWEGWRSGEKWGDGVVESGGKKRLCTISVQTWGREDRGRVGKMMGESWVRWRMAGRVGEGVGKDKSNRIPPSILKLNIVLDVLKGTYVNLRGEVWISGTTNCGRGRFHTVFLIGTGGRPLGYGFVVGVSGGGCGSGVRVVESGWGSGREGF